MKITAFGPGDEQTWPACTGHPLDPRTKRELVSDADEFEYPVGVVILPPDHRDAEAFGDGDYL